MTPLFFKGIRMDFKVLAVGDVVGAPGMERIRKSLRKLKQQTGADFVIVNGENAAVVGITPNQAEDIFNAGADVITLGNHSYSKREIVDYLEDSRWVLSRILSTYCFCSSLRSSLPCSSME